ncbi:hypothetical protein MPTK1_1g21920 [Marchantia polymorpha subsp. ruderalis]|uniref:DCD domain-containing protein n=2 Tax=Marchantia polymorpha TaxID=3197 RepID=A0AAF6ASW8_MARPO|nr:hypothetical protein MARPO_0001s0528 [Marchantia polymorpha]PTQ50625.1 hypothetical protein MARPO_0001s0528 [Marchantia polymorpha]BBM99538.1 hypothetical protein Mp_1g21920 [Marchantia polymorpha subsp. ruderalis]BBM99539.1 hypothetical protein Mp_1g21920 [Marchantia polymorpha subsp. ruderalis]|eukprot:PTQ50620.1 hypothetical protein MARPO_0001s0528 [Marchantia polymorpha]
MGAGRRTETVNFNNYTAGAGGGAIKTAPQRKLAERGRLGSVIFGCTNATYNECVTNKLFGLPYSHHSYVEQIDIGMPLFLFNYNDRKMHGIFEAVSEGGLNINLHAWTGGDSGSRTQFPAQVRVQLRSDFTRIVSIPEAVFKDAIIDSYYSASHFFFEVDNEQTERLIKLFERQVGNHLKQATVVFKSPVIPAPPPNAWQTVGNTSKVWKKTVGNVENDEKLKMKKPATVIMSEWEKGAQYVSSSSKEAVSDSFHQESVWMNAHRDEESESEASEESPTDTPNHKPPETVVEPDSKLKVVVKVENSEVDQGLSKSSSGYVPKSVVITDPYLSTSDKGSRTVGADSEEWTEAKKYEMQRVLGRLKQITLEQVETARPQAEMPSQASASHSLSEWERLARERSTHEQAILKEERENLGVILGKLDSTVAMTVKKNLELYSSALAQMRQDGIELRRLIDEARSRAEEARLRREEDQRVQTLLASQAATIISMGAKITSLEEKVVDLTKYSGKSTLQKSVGYIYEERVSTLERQSLPDIYLIGGLGDQLSRLESVMIWSPETDKLRTAAPMLTPRCCAGASVLNEHIYVFGGGDGSSWYDTVEKYDRSLNEWRSCASMKTQRGSLGGVTVGERIYAVGGGNGMASFSEVECFDPHLASWLPCTSMLEKRFCVAAAELGGVLYALGGFDGEQYLMSVERFDPREALWSRLPSMSVKRGSLSAAVLNGRIYALGGYDGEGILDIVETFDPRAGRWDQGPQMCCRRAYGAVAVVDEVLYYLGGLSEDEAVDPIQRFSEKLGWLSVQPSIMGKRSCLAAVVL